jgi:hypothetical protein
MGNAGNAKQLEWLFVLGAVAISVLISSALLQAAVGVANRLLRAARGGERGDAIPMPGVRAAMGMAFVATLAQGAVNSAAAGLLGLRAKGIEKQLQDDPALGLSYALLTLLTGFVAWCVILTFALPTSFNRAAIVTLLLHVFAVALGIALGAVLVAAYLLLAV